MTTGNTEVSPPLTSKLRVICFSTSVKIIFCSLMAGRPLQGRSKLSFGQITNFAVNCISLDSSKSKRVNLVTTLYG